MKVESLKQIFRHRVRDFSLINELTTLMQKFEVILLLDEQRILIPSLLPPGEVDSCVVFPKSVDLPDSEADYFDHVRKEPTAPIFQTPYVMFVRYYHLPFVPNGFLARLIARIMGSDIIDHVRRSLSAGTVEQQSVLNAVHWQCWRDGIALIWKRMEIFRIAPLSRLSAGTSQARVMSKSGENLVEATRGVEIKVVVLPEDVVSGYSVMRSPKGIEQIPQIGRCLGTWLLHQATTTIESVFSDWYEGCARRKGFEMSSVQVTNPCPACFHEVRQEQSLAITPPLVRRITQSISLAARNFTRKPVTAPCSNDKPTYLFPSPYCAYVVAEDKRLECPRHGGLLVEDVAPDLVCGNFIYYLLGLGYYNAANLQYLLDLGYDTANLQYLLDRGYDTANLHIS